MNAEKLERGLPDNEWLCKSMKEAKDILNNLTNLNGNLVFCDDSDVHGQPNPDFVADIRVLCAIQMESSKYGKLDLLQLLQQHMKRELHTTEVVNPSKDSEWYGVDYQIRTDVLKHAKNLVLSNVEKIYYCHVSQGQYTELRKEAEKHGSVNANMKSGLKRVFLRTLFEKLAGLQQPIALVMDQENDIQEPKFDSSYKESILEGGAPIIAESSLIQGIQLADFAAWSITRYVRKRNKWGEGIKKPFDNIAAEFLAESFGRIEHLLNIGNKNA